MSKITICRKLGLYSAASGLCLGLLCSPTAQAQTAAGPSAKPQPPQATEEISEVVVTAQRRTERLQDVPIAVQALQKEEIRDLGIKSTADIGQFASNVGINLPSGEGNFVIVTIRGIGLNDSSSNNSGPNGVYVDEVYISAPAAQTGQTFDLERLEVLKGPQGTLYGRNTTGGALNFVTAKPTDTVTGDLLTSYGSFNTYNIEGALGGPIAANLTGRVAFVTNQSDGFMKNLQTGGRENGQHNFAGRVAVEWKPTEDLRLLFNVHGQKVDQVPTEYRHVGTMVRDPSGAPPGLGGAQCSATDILAGRCVDAFGFGTPNGYYQGQYNRTQHLRLNDYGGYVRADYSLNGLDLTSLTAFNHNDRFHPEDTDANPARLIEINYAAKSDTWSQEFRASGSAGALKYVGGIYYLHEILKQDQPLFLFQDYDLFLGGPGAGDGIAANLFDNSRQKTDSIAVFGQADYDVTDKLKLTLGARYTDERKSFLYHAAAQIQEGGLNHYTPVEDIGVFHSALHDGAFNYRVALAYTIRPGLLAYGSVSSGFKSGGFNGAFLSTDPAEIAVQLRPVRPEHVTTYELGFKGTFFDRRLLFDVGAFYNAYRDEQVFTLINSPVPNNAPVNVLDNAPRAHTDGLDIQLIGKPTRNLTITENLGLLEAKLDRYTVTLAPGTPDYSGNRLPLAPTVTSSTVVDYKIGLGGGEVDIQASANYKTKQFFDTSNDPLIIQPAYWIFNGRLAYTLPGGRIEVAAYGRNLAQKKYFVGASDLANPFGMIEYTVGRPREFGVELNYRF